MPKPWHHGQHPPPHQPGLLMHAREAGAGSTTCAVPGARSNAPTQGVSNCGTHPSAEGRAAPVIWTSAGGGEGPMVHWAPYVNMGCGRSGGRWALAPGSSPRAPNTHTKMSPNTCMGTRAWNTPNPTQDAPHRVQPPQPQHTHPALLSPWQQLPIPLPCQVPTAPQYVLAMAATSLALGLGILCSSTLS